MKRQRRTTVTGLHGHELQDTREPRLSVDKQDATDGTPAASHGRGADTLWI